VTRRSNDKKGSSTSQKLHMRCDSEKVEGLETESPYVGGGLVRTGPRLGVLPRILCPRQRLRVTRRFRKSPPMAMSGTLFVVAVALVIVLGIVYSVMKTKVMGRRTEGGTMNDVAFPSSASLFMSAVTQMFNGCQGFVRSRIGRQLTLKDMNNLICAA